MNIMKAVTEYKAYFAIAFAVLAILAYAIPYGMDVEAKGPPASHPGKGTTNGDGYGLVCTNHVGKGPVFCR